MLSTITHLECSRCAKTYPHDRLQNLCTCGMPLLARYNLAAAKKTLTAENLSRRAPDMWRYAEVLPGGAPVTLGEGMTPLVRCDRLSLALGLTHLYIKDEGLNPTGSFKARGLSAAVTCAKALGAKTLAIPTAGNAGGALAAYAARAGLKAVVAMPRDTPRCNVMECQATGAEVHMIDGLISDCARYVAERKDSEGWFDVSTLKEPYRVEGKKTMGYELWEQFGGRLPDVIFYPTGGGVGMIGMAKAFDEMEAMGWIGAARPRMVVVQAAGCPPVVDAFTSGAAHAEFCKNASTIASGLRVPKPLGDFLLLNTLRATGGTAIAISDAEILATGRELAAAEGIFAAPEGAATVAASRHLAERKWLAPDEKIVLFNTGTGYKYSEAWEKALAPLAGN